MNAKRWRKAGAAAALSILVAGPASAYQVFGGERESATLATEYYNAALGEYLVTVSADETAALDGGSAPGWTRTGKAAFYTVGTPMAAIVELGGLQFAAPVCRFFIPPASHFLSALPSECATLAENSAGIVLETDAAFYAWLPDDEGRCPRLYTKVGGFDFAPVYRLWNSHSGVAHRLTTSRTERDAMVADGWTSEGYGEEGVAMCVPSWNSN